MQQIRKYSKVLLSLGLVMTLALVMQLFTFGARLSDDEYKQLFRAKYNVYALEVPKELDFAEEQMPLYDFEVFERMDRELLINTYWQTQTILIHKRANRWFPVIEPILKRNGIPEDFKYIPLVENNSSGNRATNRRSRIVILPKIDQFYEMIEKEMKK